MLKLFIHQPFHFNLFCRYFKFIYIQSDGCVVAIPCIFYLLESCFSSPRSILWKSQVHSYDMYPAWSCTSTNLHYNFNGRLCSGSSETKTKILHPNLGTTCSCQEDWGLRLTGSLQLSVLAHVMMQYSILMSLL